MGNWQVKLDANTAIDQIDKLASRAWAAFQTPSTAVVVELLNETRYDLRHVCNYRWQGNFMEPTDDLLAGWGRVWGMQSKGLDGCFGAVIYQIWDQGSETDAYLVIGNLIYWDGAMPYYTAEVTTTNYENEGKPKTLDLLNKGRSSAWSKEYRDTGGVDLDVKVDIWRQEITSIEENFRIQLTKGS
ncbi:hypothetical protein KBY29_06730 [Ruegeria pomeroyi]|nr:hypothetical protein [Ruegeria pomeroyi]